MDAYNRDYMVAAAFEGQEGENNQTKVTAYFNNQAYHTIAISLSMVGNTMLRSLTGNSDYTIETINHPLPRTTAAMLQQDMGEIPNFNLIENTVSVKKYTRTDIYW